MGRAPKGKDRLPRIETENRYESLKQSEKTKFMQHQFLELWAEKLNRLFKIETPLQFLQFNYSNTRVMATEVHLH